MNASSCLKYMQKSWWSIILQATHYIHKALTMVSSKDNPFQPLAQHCSQNLSGSVAYWCPSCASNSARCLWTSSRSLMACWCLCTALKRLCLIRPMHSNPAAVYIIPQIRSHQLATSCRTLSAWVSPLACASTFVNTATNIWNIPRPTQYSSTCQSLKMASHSVSARATKKAIPTA